MHLLEGPELSMHYGEDSDENNAQHTAGFEPMTSQLQGVCSAAALLAHVPRHLIELNSEAILKKLQGVALTSNRLILEVK